MQAWSSLSLHRPTSGMCVCVFVCRHLHVHVRITHMGHVRTHAYNVRDTCILAELLSVMC